ncbi:MAG: uridine diphosphate-N-acetylglucosamine-binding protein YvcK [Candidatus Bruticola sp.]
MLNKFFSLFKWLLPGMGVKRWILSIALGLWLFATGLMLLLSRKTSLSIEISLQNILHDAVGFDISGITIDIIMTVLGLTVIWWSVYHVFTVIYSTERPAAARSIVDLVYEKRQLSHGLKITALGGGTGLSTLLRGLKKYTSNITAIVSVSDDGGSSGRLSKELGILPPGDLRNCMTALADDENLLNELFRYRFRDGQGLEGHSFGNLFLAALTDMYDNDFEEALRKGSQILNIRGRVLPATLTSTTLCAKMRDGRIIKGESEIPKANGQIIDAFLEPRNCTPPDEVLKAIAEADCIVLGPGSLYTSVIPPLLINGIADAVKKAKAPKIYVCNVMTQPGETSKYTAADHLQAIYHHVGSGIVDYIIVNAAPPSKLRKKYQKTGAHPIKADLARLRTMQVQPIVANLVSEETVVRHDPVYLAETIVDTIAEHRSKSGEFTLLNNSPHSGLRVIQ